MNKENKCVFCVTVFLLVVAVSLLTFSYLASTGVVTHDGNVWFYKDYWLAWVSFLSLVGGCTSLVAGVIWGSVYVWDSCITPPKKEKQCADV